jgi:hypothetical protein
MYDALEEHKEEEEKKEIESMEDEASKWLKRSPKDGLQEAGVDAWQLQDPLSILRFWRTASSTFPRLARWARLVFAIPATSAAVERMWHRAKLTVTPLRHAISPELVRDELFIALNEDQL